MIQGKNLIQENTQNDRRERKAGTKQGKRISLDQTTGLYKSVGHEYESSGGRDPFDTQIYPLKIGKH